MTVYPVVQYEALVIEQDDNCQWNELIFEVNGQQVIVPKSALHEIGYFISQALTGMNRMEKGIENNPLWKGIER
jgi:hypothetical protein